MHRQDLTCQTGAMRRKRSWHRSKRRKLWAAMLPWIRLLATLWYLYSRCIWLIFDAIGLLLFPGYGAIFLFTGVEPRCRRLPGVQVVGEGVVESVRLS